MTYGGQGSAHYAEAILQGADEEVVRKGPAGTVIQGVLDALK